MSCNFEPCKDVFGWPTSTRSGPLAFFGSGFAQIFRQLVSIKVKKVSNTNLAASRYIKREKALFLLDIRVAQKRFSLSPLMLGLTPYDGLASHLGGLATLLVASFWCYGNWEKQWVPCVPPNGLLGPNLPRVLTIWQKNPVGLSKA